MEARAGPPAFRNPPPAPQQPWPWAHCARPAALLQPPSQPNLLGTANARSRSVRPAPGISCGWARHPGSAAACSPGRQASRAAARAIFSSSTTWRRSWPSEWDPPLITGQPGQVAGAGGARRTAPRRRRPLPPPGLAPAPPAADLPGRRAASGQARALEQPPRCAPPAPWRGPPTEHPPPFNRRSAAAGCARPTSMGTSCCCASRTRPPRCCRSTSASLSAGRWSRRSTRSPRWVLGGGRRAGRIACQERMPQRMPGRRQRRRRAAADRQPQTGPSLHPCRSCGR